jgi:hypothetical protein
VRVFIALAAVAIAAGCSRSDSNATSRPGDTAVAHPAVVQEPVAQPPVEHPHPDSSARAVLDCGVKGKPVLTGAGIGELKKGKKVADVKAVCHVDSDSNQPGPEGSTERVLVVPFGPETVRAVVADDKIFRISVSSPYFKTSDGLGVDTPLRKLAGMRGAQFFPGEDGVYGFVADHCGISFRFSVPMRPPKGGQWTVESINKSHGDAAVDRVLLTGCSR